MHLSLVILLGFAFAVANGNISDEGQRHNFEDPDGLPSKLKEMVLSARTASQGIIPWVGNSATSAANGLTDIVFDGTSTIFGGLAVLAAALKEVLTGNSQ